MAEPSLKSAAPRRGGERSPPASVKQSVPSHDTGASLSAHYAAGPVMRLAAPIQAKVSIGKAGDPYEREADAVADRVTLGQPAGPISTLAPGGLADGVARQEEEPVQETAAQREEEEPVQEAVVQREEEEPVQEAAVQREEEEPVQETAVQREEEEPVQEAAVQREEEEPVQEAAVQREEEEPVQEAALQREDEEPVQEAALQREEEEPVQEAPEEVEESAVSRREAAPAPPPARASTLQSVAARAIRERGPGEPMKPSTRAPLESGMGTDLRDVRVHGDGKAQEAAGALRARAFTHGRDIWLGRGESQDDLHLMAHESTHVLQQGGVVRRAPVVGPEEEEEAGAPGATSAPEAATGAGSAAASGQEPAALEEAGDGAASSQASTSGEPGALTEGEATAGEGAEGATEEDASDVETEVAEEEGEGGGAAKEEAEPPAAPAPEEDARFKGVMKRLGASAEQERTHAPAADKVGEARAAAEPPTNETMSQAQAGQVGAMAQQEAGKPDKNDFLSLLRAELARIAPKNMEETEKFKKEGRAGKLKESLTGTVKQQKDDAANAIESTTKAEPDPSGIEPKAVTPIPEEAADKPVADLRSKDVLPLPKQDEEVSAEKNKQKAADLMAQNDLDEEQLEKANEPQFNEALESKKELEQHADEVPEKYRETEQAYVAEAEAGVAQDEEAATAQMREKRNQAKGEVLTEQEAAKKKEEEERQRVAAEIESLFEKTKKKVEDKLASLDGEVDQMFTAGEKQARDRFESYVDQQMSDYKWHRYIDRIGGSILWAKDKLFGMPDEVNRFYEEGRDRYIQDMDVVLVKIADTVETRLKEAKEEIEKGKAEIDAYVAELPKNLQKAGEDAQKGLESRFGDLEQGVEDKKQELATKMAKRYQESREKLDARIEELKAANQGLLDGFLAKIREIIEIIRNFKNRVMSLLKSGADTIRQIVKDPIGFLKNLLKSVKKGFNQFKDNIFAHLKKGLMGWLFGTLSKAGVEVPSEFSIKGIFGLVMQVLGLTKQRIREKLVRLVGAKNVERVEAAWSFVSTLISEGPAGLWSRIKEFLGDLKETVMSAIRDFIITQIVKQAVIWLVSLFNPAAALLKAIKLIYDVVMFFVENIQRILELVEAVVASVAKIVAGNLAAAADWIENAMSRTVPVIISFLARLLGLGGISGKIKEIIRKIQKRVDKAVDKVLKKIVGGLKKFVGKAKAAAGKIFEWWKTKKGFKAGGKSHSVQFQGKGKSAKIVVKSTPKTLESHLAAVKEKGATEKQLKAIRKKAAEVDALKKDTSGKDIPMSKKQGKLISKKLTELAALLAKAEGGGAVPPTHVTFSTHANNGDVDAGPMIADPLSLKPGNTSGSQPTQSSRLWNSVRQRQGFYIRGHLLNHHLHGPGEKRNLTPITGKLNTSMEVQVESKAKKAVLGENKVVSYKVTPVYGSHPKREHIPDEAKLITEFKFELKEKKKKKEAVGDQAGHWENGKDLGNYPKSMTHTLPEDVEVGTVRQPVNLMTSSVDEIAASGVEGMDATIAAQIVGLRSSREGGFHSYGQLPTSVSGRLQEANWVKLR